MEAQRPAMERQLISAETNNAVRCAFNKLGETVLAHSPSLDGLVREMLRPILKSWVDDNLPTMVERLVRAELERALRPQ
jgi:uncharacterized protein